MNVNSKHLATFLLGAAAALGAYKYANMTDEEKEKLANDLKEKAKNLKKQALDAEDKALDYFNELKTKGSDAMKDYMPRMEEFFNNLFRNEGSTTAETSGATAGEEPNTAGSATIGNSINTTNNTV